jgi:hypothetical protein
LVGERRALINQLRAILLERRFIAPQGRRKLEQFFGRANGRTRRRGAAGGLNMRSEAETIDELALDGGENTLAHRSMGWTAPTPRPFFGDLDGQDEKAVQMLAIDLGNQSFHVHGLSADGEVVSRRIGRQKLAALVESLDPKVIAMEACATAHCWAGLFMGAGRHLRLNNPHFVKPFVRGF